VKHRKKATTRALCASNRCQPTGAEEFANTPVRVAESIRPLRAKQSRAEHQWNIRSIWELRQFNKGKLALYKIRNGLSGYHFVA
jgi:hypothetical protein